MKISVLLCTFVPAVAFTNHHHVPRTFQPKNGQFPSTLALMASTLDEAIVEQKTTKDEPGSNQTAVIESIEETAKAVVEAVSIDAKELEPINETVSDLLENATATAALVLENEDVAEILLLEEVELEAEKIAEELVDEECEINPLTGEAKDELCVDEESKQSLRLRMKATIGKTLKLISRGSLDDDEQEEDDEAEMSAVESITSSTWKSKISSVMGAVRSAFGKSLKREKEEDLSGLTDGELLERGWEERANSSSIKRNAEVWKFALKAVFRVLKPRKMRKKGASEEEITKAQVEAAEFIRDNLLRLGPSFVKLGQVASTRTDVLPKTYTDVLKTLTDEVPGFSGARAKEIVSKELGRPVDEIFRDFSPEPLKAASLGQVHTAFYKGTKVAIKVQRAGLKELFDIDLKNLRKLAVLLEKFDPKSDGADRDWVSIYDESERQLYREIDYLNEAKNAERFARDFADIEWVRVPRVYREVTTPRVLVMEFVESMKLTDIKTIEEYELDRKLLAKRVADSFLRQVIETSYFHCDPHSGNLCVDKQGNLVFYDFGQMDELKPNVSNGLKTFCKALFAGGPMISDLQLARNAKELVNGVEQAGVLSKGADRLAVEKLSRYFMRSFKDAQLGKSKGKNIKETLGTDLQTLTENNSFRFPSTFTFVFRAYVCVEGIGKELDPDFDLGKLAQPFIEKFIDAEKGYASESEKNFSIFQKATGLNKDDINTAIMQPRKIAYIEETVRAIETGSLKIRVRSLENEKSLERMGLRQGAVENMLLASLCLNVAGLASKSLFRSLGLAGAGFFLLQTFIVNAKIKKFDKTQAKYVSSDFEDDTSDE
ncbi:aarF domain-containing kinase [Fistulifera solaris]|uniref:AarF domain-containing kinase n=1 Tax=Fistulifera solaris TaxID=1519565 RepID=A0A1Z5JTY2_FISSO|nr:aarF domain-containing kinase [Fistulifera solaris]|eukprot:GAX17221.1 aarF domain-containing kinase [Fistulifera solaris]